MVFEHQGQGLSLPSATLLGIAAPLWLGIEPGGCMFALPAILSALTFLGAFGSTFNSLGDLGSLLAAASFRFFGELLKLSWYNDVEISGYILAEIAHPVPYIVPNFRGLTHSKNYKVYGSQST